MRTLYFDTATTGRWIYRERPSASFQPHLARLAYLIEDDGVVGQTESLLIEPQPGWDYDPDSVHFHHITPARAHMDGIPLREAFGLFVHAMHTCDRLVAFNLWFHWSVMERTQADLGGGGFLEPSASTQSFCAMRKAQYIVNKGRFPRLCEAYKHFNIENEPLRVARDPIDVGLLQVRAVRTIWNGVLAATPKLETA